MSDLPKKRGRPRAFDLDVALASAGRTFLRHGYAATSLDALTSDMGVNKPSLYAAFGDKRALFLEVLHARYRTVAERYRMAFDAGKTLEESLRNVFEAAVEVSLGEGGPPGCPIAAAETTDALDDAEIGAFVREFRAQTDKGMAKWIRARLRREGETSAEGVARLVNGVLHDLTLRARVGERRAKLLEIARDAARVLARAAG